MRRILDFAQRDARVDVEVTFSARVPVGSASHLSGKRFAAPDPASVSEWNVLL